MKRHFIRSFFLFALLLAILYPILLFILENYAPQQYKPDMKYLLGSYGHMYSRMAEVKNVRNIDILFLGSSHAYRGFDTRVFKENGIKAFNLGSSAQTPIQTRVLLNRYLDQLNPRLIIWEVCPGDFSIEGWESSLDVISNDKNDLLSILMALKIDHAKVYNTLIYGFFRDLFNLNSSFAEPIIKGDDTYIPGGYVEKKNYFFRTIAYPQNEWNLNKKLFISLGRMVSILKKKNIELILVSTPVTPALYKSYTNNRAFEDKIKKYGPYYNFNEILNLNDSLHFYDPEHLNQNGVAIFNNRLIEILNSPQPDSVPSDN